MLLNKPHFILPVEYHPWGIHDAGIEMNPRWTPQVQSQDAWHFAVIAYSIISHIHLDSKQWVKRTVLILLSIFSPVANTMPDTQWVFLFNN